MLGFISNGSVIWNNLPDEIRMATDVSDFKWRYKCTMAYLGHGEKTNYSANPPGRNTNPPGRNSQSAQAEK